MRKNNLFGKKILPFSIITIIILSIFVTNIQAKSREEKQEPLQIISNLDRIRNEDPADDKSDENTKGGKTDERSEDKGGNTLANTLVKNEEETENPPNNPSDNPPLIGGESQPPATTSSNNGNAVTRHSTTNQDTENAQETENSRNIILAGNMHEFIPDNCATTGFYKVKLIPTVDLEDPILTINTVEELSEEIPEYSGEYNLIFRYLDIKITSDEGEYLTEEKISSLSFNFELKNSETFEKSIDPNDIRLVRYHDGWQELETDIIDIDEGKIYFEATTPGLSTFAIVGKNVEENEDPSSTMGSNIPEIPWFVLIGIIISGIIGLLVFLVKSKNVYINREIIEEEIIQDNRIPFKY